MHVPVGLESVPQCFPGYPLHCTVPALNAAVFADAGFTFYTGRNQIPKESTDQMAMTIQT